MAMAAYAAPLTLSARCVGVRALSFAVGLRRPLRSALYLPASSSRALAKAPSLPCDAIVLDLEDAVAPTAKGNARTAALNAVAAGFAPHQQVAVRVNALSTPWGRDDLEAVAEARDAGRGPHAVVLPKVDSVEDVEAVATVLAPVASLPLWCMVETPLGVVNAASVASSPHVHCLIAGLEDLRAALGAAALPERASLLHAISAIVLGARVGGIPALDGVYTKFRDLDGLRLEAEQGKAYGFSGKSIIHPSNVEVVNSVWTPSAAEIAHAEAVVEAFDTAVSTGAGVAVLDGRLVENLHADAARQILATRDALADRAN